MKKYTIGVVSAVLMALLVLTISPVMAAKPQNAGNRGNDVIALSNGFPSGPHFNLNLHGRELGWTGDPDPGGKSVYIGITGNSTIEYVSNKKAKNTGNASQFDLYTIDPLAEPFDETPARVYLPYNILVNDEPVSAGGYYVFGRILGSPNKGSGDTPSSILIWPTFVVQSVNCTGDESAFGDLLEDPNNADLALGLITSQGNLYGAGPEGFYRFPDPLPEPTKGNGKAKGNSKGVEITQLFKWSGYVTDNTSLDADGSGTLNITDLQTSTTNITIRAEWLPFEAEWLDDAFYQTRFNISPAPDPNGEVDDENEFIAWLHWLSLGDYGVTEYNESWIFNIADLVIAGQTVSNDGTKLFQIRFYPVETTEFESQYMPDPPQ